MKRKVLPLLLALTLCVGLTIPALAAGTVKTIPTGGFGGSEEEGWGGILIDGWELSNFVSEDIFYFSAFEKEKDIQNKIYYANAPARLTSLTGLMHPDSYYEEGVYRFSGSLTDEKTLPDAFINSGLLTHIEPATLGEKEMSAATNSDGTLKEYDYPTGSVYILEDGVYLLYCDLIAGISLVVVGNEGRTSSAATTETPSSWALESVNDAITAADRLHELGLFAGVGNNADGTPNYDLDRAPTRAEAITLLVRLLGKETEAKSKSWTTPFTDVADWAKPYVGYAYTNGLTSGTSANTFGGNNTVSATQYLTFVLRALSYTSGIDFEWDKAWELTDKLGITNGEYGAGSAFTRGDAVIVSANALDKKLKDGSKTLLEAIEEALANAPEVLSVTEGNAGNTFSCKGQAMTFDGSEWDYSGVKGGTDEELENEYATATVEVVSSTEASFTVKVPFPLTEAFDYNVSFIYDDGVKSHGFTFQYYQSGTVNDEGKFTIESKTFSMDEGTWLNEPPYDGDYNDLSDVIFTENGTNVEQGILKFNVKLPEGCPFSFDVIGKYKMYCSVLAMFG